MTPSLEDLPMGRTALLLVLALVPFSPGPTSAGVERQGSQERRAPSSARRPQGFRVPVHFETNAGQAPSGVGFVARGGNLAAHLTVDGAVLLLGGRPRPTGLPASRTERDESPPVLLPLAMRFEGACADSRLSSGRPLPGRSHYLLGADRDHWVRNVPTFADVENRGAWPGITVRWGGSERGLLRYDFHVAPGADPSLIGIRFSTPEAPRVDGAGNLVIPTAVGPVIHGAPVAWQVIDGRRRSVECAFAVAGDGLASFRLGPWSREHGLTIDPEIDYSSFMYGDMGDLALDAEGSIYACGSIYTGVPFKPVNPYQGTLAGQTDGFVMKLDASGTTIEYATYIGGKYVNQAQSVGYDYFFGMDVDSQGRAVVGGYTNSDNYPTTAGAFQKQRVGAGSHANGDCALTMFTADGSDLVWSSYLGGGGTDQVDDVLYDSSGNVVVYGLAGSSNFPVKDAAQQSYGGNEDTFVTVVNASGSAILRSTFLGGLQNDRCVRARFDGQGRLCLFGHTTSSNLPVKSAYQSAMNGGGDAFLARLASDGKSFDFVTYFGGDSYDGAGDMALGPQGRWFLAGHTMSRTFPLQDALQGEYGGGTTDAFVAVFDVDVTTLEYSSYLGGGDYDETGSVHVDAGGGLLIVGATLSLDFPLVSPIDSQIENGKYDTFITTFSSALDAITWSTYYGGSGEDHALRAEPSPDDDLWVQVLTYGETFPIKDGLLETGDVSAFFRIDLPSIYTKPPFNLRYQFLGLTSLRLIWNDPGNLETGFHVQWKSGGGDWEDLATLGANVLFHDLAGLAPQGVYEFRVSAFNDLAESAYAGPITVTMPSTPVQPPAAPTSLTATAVGPRRVALAWTDNGDDESFFHLVRATSESGPFATVATPSINIVSANDEHVRPDRTYWYEVKAVNPIGSSPWSNVASATTPATLAPAIVKGRIRDSAKPAADKVTLTLVPGGDGPDPMAAGLVLRLGGPEATPVVTIPGGDEGWTVKKGRGTWKSPKNPFTKIKVRYDPATGVLTVKISKTSLPDPIANPVRVTVEIGVDGGHTEADWTPGKREGQFAYP